MENRIDLMLDQRALERGVVFDGGGDDSNLRNQTAADQLALRVPIAHQRGDLRALAQQMPNQPRAHQASCAGDQNASGLPESAQTHTFHGACPEVHSFSSSIFSRMVSMGCQKPS